MSVTVSVVVPVRDAARTIEGQLSALAAQEGEADWELVASDNGSRDDTVAVVEQWGTRLPVRVVDASQRRGPAHARNVGVMAARGSYIVMCDADDTVMPGWRRALTTALEHSELATGPLDRATLNDGYGRRWRAAGVNHRPRVAHGYLPMIPGANLAFRRTVFETIGGFDPDLRRGEDVDFVWRAIRSGARIGFAPDAVVRHRLPYTAAGVVRKGFLDGYYEPALFKRHRAAGMRRQSSADARREFVELWRAAVAAVLAGRPAHDVVYDMGQRMGRIAGSARHHCLFL